MTPRAGELLGSVQPQDISLKHSTHFGQTSSNGPSLLGSEVQRRIFLLLVEFAEILSRLLVHHGHDPRDRLADSVANMKS